MGIGINSKKVVNFGGFWVVLVLTQQGEEGLTLVAVQMEAPGGVPGGSLGAWLGWGGGGVLCGALGRRRGWGVNKSLKPPLH